MMKDLTKARKLETLSAGLYKSFCLGYCEGAQWRVTVVLTLESHSIFLSHRTCRCGKANVFEQAIEWLRGIEIYHARYKKQKPTLNLRAS